MVENQSMRCAYCCNDAITRCNACNKQLCADHDIFDDLYHTGGLLYHPRHWCKDCIGKRQGKGAGILVVIAIIVMMGIIAVVINS